MLPNITERIFNIASEEEFNQLALEIFFFQYENNPVYNNYVKLINCDTGQINNFKQIPFLPIEFFKTQKVICGKDTVKEVFCSSGTTGSQKSHHYITDISVYETSAIKSFERFYGTIADYTILALLPSYVERRDSSLIWMTKLFMSKSDYKADCGFFGENNSELAIKLKNIYNDPSRKLLLIGVSFALLDFAKNIKLPLNNIIVMETGGMKGKRKEMVREELHDILCKNFGVTAIHSEYGMTELLSQAYSQGNGVYNCPPWMKVLIREINDPLSLTMEGRSGGINVIDLANINSCSFIATQDVGKCNADGTFIVAGRFDHSDTRGCNLMMT